MRRASSLRSNPTAVDRTIASSYDSVKVVSDNIHSVLKVARNIINGLSYLGAHETAPSTRLDSTDILDGDYYYNIPNDTIQYYSTSTGLWHVVDAQTAIDASNASEANRAQTVLDAAATASDRAQTTYDANSASNSANQTGLDRIQTGEDALSSSESAAKAKISEDNSLVSENNSATSEANALESANIAAAAAELAAEVSGTAGQDSVQVVLVSDNGSAFKNNTGQNKSLTAQVYIGGVLSEGSYDYTWYAGGLLAYVDVVGSYISTSPGGGVFPADGTNMSVGLNFKTIIIDPSDVEFNSNLNLTCSVSNI